MYTIALAGLLASGMIVDNICHVALPVSKSGSVAQCGDCHIELNF